MRRIPLQDTFTHTIAGLLHIFSGSLRIARYILHITADVVLNTIDALHSYWPLGR